MAAFNKEKPRKTKTNYFGIGLSKTGTTTLAEAMGTLGYRSVQGLSYRKYVRPSEWDFLCGGPVFNVYKWYDLILPGSKFIYTPRDMDAWIRSADKFWKYMHNSRMSKRLVERLTWEYGTTYFNKDAFIRRYVAHEEDVMAYFQFRQDDLLVLDICGGDGWEQLCPFLGEEVPDAEWPWNRKQFTREGEPTGLYDVEQEDNPWKLEDIEGEDDVDTHE